MYCGLFCFYCFFTDVCTVKILLGYSYYPHPNDVKITVESWLSRLRNAGFQVDSYPLTINPPNFPIWWKELDLKWKLGDKTLLKHYEKLALKLEEYDVFLNWNGINIHPDFLKQLKTFNVYGCFDDPESSERLSKPVAASYDLCMIGNIAEIETYKSWGVKNVEFWPIGFMSTDYDPTLTEEMILYGERKNDIVLLCEKKYVPERIKRLDEYSIAFPNGKYFGAGWSAGFLSESEKLPLYLNSKIGPNFHNSTGPINFRTYTLPACGVMQICDNKSNLGKVFELDKEVVGFDSIKEAIEKTNYYLANDIERRKIAAAGWKRSLKDYNELEVFSLIEKNINKLNPKIKLTERINNPVAFLEEHRIRTLPSRFIYKIKSKFADTYYKQD